MFQEVKNIMDNRIHFLQGNEVCVEAALYAGLDFFAAILMDGPSGPHGRRCENSKR